LLAERLDDFNDAFLHDASVERPAAEYLEVSAESGGECPEKPNP